MTLTEEELSVLRNSLNIIEIPGSYAKFLSSLQLKIEKEYDKIKLENKKQQEKLQKEKMESLPEEFKKPLP